MRSTAFMIAVAAVVAFPMNAQAQQTEALRSTSVSVSGGALSYELEGGTGWAPLTAVRVAVPFGRAFTAEFGGLAAWPRQDFTVPGSAGQPQQNLEGERALLVVAPEAQLQVTLGTGNIAPYLGVGGGLAIDRAERQDGSTATEFTGSAAAGLRMALADRLGGVAEVRLRGVGTDDFFNTRTAEFSLGLSWALKRSPYMF
jgi:hypothetical protein